MSNPPSSNIQHVSCPFDPTDWQIYYVYDPGARYTAVAAQIVRKGERTKPDHNVVLALQEPNRE